MKYIHTYILNIHFPYCSIFSSLYDTFTLLIVKIAQPEDQKNLILSKKKSDNFLCLLRDIFSRTKYTLRVRMQKKVIHVSFLRL